MKAAAKLPAASGAAAEQEQQPAEGQEEQEQQPAEEQAPAAEPAAAGGVPIEGSTLPRGTGLLFLLQSSWGGKGRPLPSSGRALVSGQVYTHYTVGCLMTKQGLLFKPGQPQQVSVRVAQEFLAEGVAAVGLWSSSAFPVTVEPYATLLLTAQPAVVVKKRFNADAPGYMALYGSALSEESISAALGEPAGQPGAARCLLRCPCGYTCPIGAETLLCAQGCACELQTAGLH